MYENKKVIFVTGSLSDGGAERQLAILASGCAELGADVTLIVVRDKKNVYPVSSKVRVVQLQSKGRFPYLQRIIQFHRVLKDSSANTVIPFLPLMSLYTVIANIGVGKRIILAEISDPNRPIFTQSLPLKDKIGRFFMQTLGLHKLADWTVFQTPDAQAWYSKKVQERSCVIPNPLDTSTLPERYTGQREKRVVAAGRFNEVKNFPMLIKGFARFYQTHPEYNLWLYGAGELKLEYEKLAQDLGIREKVVFPGFSTNLYADIQKAGMYVSTSDHEGISNSMLEALGMGIPTIVTDCPIGGARMFVHTDVNGILIPVRDVDALEAALCKIADDGGYAERISLEAVKVRDILDRDRICKQWMELF